MMSFNKISIIKYFLTIVLASTINTHLYGDYHPKNEEFTIMNGIIETDRDSYFYGEYVGFTVFNNIAIPQSAFPLTTVVYVELYSFDLKPVIQTRIASINGIAKGVIQIPDTLSSGRYFLIATIKGVTNNWQSGKFIQIINPLKALRVNNSSDLYSVFPESGNIIPNISNNLIIRKYKPILDSKISDSIFIINSANLIVASCYSIGDGLYKSSFVPLENQKYFVSDFKNSPTEIAINDKGIVIQISDIDNKLVIFQKGYANTPLVLKCIENKKLVKSKEIRLMEGENEFAPDEFQSEFGLMTIAIFDTNNHPISERTFYSKNSIQSNDNQLDIFESSINDTLLELSINNNSKNDLNLVYYSLHKSLFSFPNPFKPEIYNALKNNLVISDAFMQYFRCAYNSNEDPLDNILLMLSGISGQTDQNIKENIISYEVNQTHLNGTIKTQFQGIPIADTYLRLIFLESNPQLFLTKSNSNGEFVFEVPIQQRGKSDVMIIPENFNERILVTFNWPFPEFVPEKFDQFIYMPVNAEANWDQEYKFLQISGFYKDENRLTKLPSFSSNSPFFGTPDVHTVFDDYTQLNNMQEAFKELGVGLRTRQKKGEYSIGVIEKNKNNILGPNPLLLYNGQPVNQFMDILKLDIKNTDFFDIIQNQFLLNNQKYDGVLNVVSKDKSVNLPIPFASYRTIIPFIENEYAILDRRGEDSSDPESILYNTFSWNVFKQNLEENSLDISCKLPENGLRYSFKATILDSSGKVISFGKEINEL